MVTALILDFDGLIIDSETAVATAWREVFDREGFPFPDELWRSMVGTRENDDVLVRELERLTGRDFDEEQVEAEKRARSVEIANGFGPLPGVVDALDYAASLGLALGIASSSSAWWVRGHLGRLGLLGRFAAICTKEDAPKTKPDPGVYLEALGRLGVTAAEALAVEDSEPGVTAAKGAGLAVVAVPGSFTEHMDFSAADAVLAELGARELEWVLRRMDGLSAL